MLWLLEELNVKYEVKTYKRQNLLAPPELKAIHPLGKSPIVSIEAPGMSKPLVLAESGCIMEYLVDHFGPQWSPKRYAEGKEGQIGGETEEWLRYRYFMHYAEGSLTLYLIMAKVVESMSVHPAHNLRTETMTEIRNNAPFFVRPITNAVAGNIESTFVHPNLKDNWEFLEGQLATSPNNGKYLCGKDITAADLLLSFPVDASSTQPSLTTLTKEKYPRLFDYVASMKTREAYKRAVQKIIDIDGSYDDTL